MRGVFGTIGLSTDFLAPAPPGAWPEGRPDLVRAARSAVLAHGIVAANGAPALRANGIVRVPPPIAEA
ncbi:MAG: hypothetical protein K2X49_17740 [Acetobacteraceae bacterium]|nr:hypothetical protein [Acetobacteraceae bacterium]